MTAHHGTPAPVTTRGASSQAGVPTFRPGLSRVRHCPKCRTGTLAYSRRGDDPWAYCTTPDCTYEFD